MSRAPRVLILCLVDPSGNPRPRRLIELCRQQGYEVHLASYPMKNPLPVDCHYPLRQPSKRLTARIGRKIFNGLNSVAAYSPALWLALNSRRYGWQAIRNALKAVGAELIVVEDLPLLPLAFALKTKVPIVFDAREYFPAEFEGNLLWRLTERPGRVALCRTWLKRCAAVMTVSPGLVARYDGEFGLTTSLVRSMPQYRDFPVNPVDPARLRLVHHGLANPDRKLESMIDVFSCLDGRFELDFYLTGYPAYQAKLKARAVPFPKIRFLDPVPFEAIIPMLNAYDIGFYFLQPTGFNTEYALPNKFFEFIQAGLAIAIGPSPDMAALVRHHDCGIVTDSFDTVEMAGRLNVLTRDDIQHYKTRSHEAARELCFEKEGQKVAALFRRLLEPGDRP